MTGCYGELIIMIVLNTRSNQTELPFNNAEHEIRSKENAHARPCCAERLRGVTSVG